MGLIILFFIFVYVGSLIGKTASKFIFKDDNFKDDSKIVINNYTTENHLHITENQAKEISNTRYTL